MSVVMPLRPGDPQAVGAWEIAGRLGEGGQSVVYLGRGADGRRVAVKVLRGLDPAARLRMEREVAAARRVAPFCTVPILDVRLDATPPYVVSEYVDGPSLQRAVETGGPLRGAALDRLAVATATALAAIHRAGVVHRDFKPHNVLLGPGGPRVIDFGIAREVDLASSLTQGPIGTPAYMAPEQIEGDQVTAAADMFAWGAVMVFAATGHPAFARDGVQALFHQILSGEPDLSGMAEPLRSIAAACLAKDPARRPTAEQVVSRLTGHGAAGAETAAGAQPPPPPPWTPHPHFKPTVLPQPRPRRAWPVLLAMLALVMVPVLALGGLVGARLLEDDGGPRDDPRNDPPYVMTLPDMCTIYDDGNGREVLRAMGAALGRRIPQGEDDGYGRWELCAFGTERFPPKNTFQIQLNLYNTRNPEQGITDARNAIRGGTDFGCTGPAATGDAAVGGEDSCEGVTEEGWVIVVARRGNVLALASCSASTVSDADRRALRRTAVLALDRTF